MAQDELADSGAFGDAADLGDIGVQRGHPLQRGTSEAVPLEVAEVGNLVESSLARHRETRAARPAVRVVPTDFDLARRVGSVLHGVGAETKDIVDAHSVAVASMHGRAVVVTADPDDILRLASAMPAVRIVTRSAR